LPPHEEIQPAVEEAVGQIAFGNNDYGIDAYHFDREGRNLYLQSNGPRITTFFKESMDRIGGRRYSQDFGDPLQDPTERLVRN